jgi:hypothetical protein
LVGYGFLQKKTKKEKKSIKETKQRKLIRNSVNQDHHINMLSSLATLATRTTRQLLTIPRQRLFNNNIYPASYASKAFSSQPASNINNFIPSSATMTLKKHTKINNNIAPATDPRLSSPLFSIKSFQSAATTAAISSVVWGPGALFEGGLAFNPGYGLGFTGLVAIHEYGHVLACKYYGIPSDAPVFAGFLAFVSHDIPKNAYQHAMVALAGPVVGTMGAVGFGAVGLCFDSPVLYNLAGLGIIMNTINLIPIKL